MVWFITNGWSYVLLAIGTFLKIEWMTVVSSAYIAFLWLPVSPEKTVTLAIAIFLLRKLFPNDERTLLVLKNMYVKIKSKIENIKNNKSHI